MENRLSVLILEKKTYLFARSRLSPRNPMATNAGNHKAFPYFFINVSGAFGIFLFTVSLSLSRAV